MYYKHGMRYTKTVLIGCGCYEEAMNNYVNVRNLDICDCKENLTGPNYFIIDYYASPFDSGI